MDSANIQQKLSSVLQHISKLSPAYHSQIFSIKNKKTRDELDGIKIETYYRVIQPVITSLYWQNPNEDIRYPVAAIAINNNKDNNAYTVPVKIATWVQSGGTRCLPIKSCATEADIENIVKVTHCAVFVEPSHQSQHYQQFIRNYLRISTKQSSYPILFLGKAGIPVIESMNNFKVSVEDKISEGLSEILVRYDSQLFRGLDLSLRLQLENKKKVGCPTVRIKPHTITASGLQPKVYMRIKNEVIVSVLQHKQKKLYFVMNKTAEFENPQSTQLWHCAIINFIDIVKGAKKQVDQKIVEKCLLGHYKIVCTSDKGYYSVN